MIFHLLYWAFSAEKLILWVYIRFSIQCVLVICKCADFSSVKWWYKTRKRILLYPKIKTQEHECVGSCVIFMHSLSSSHWNQIFVMNSILAETCLCQSQTSNCCEEDKTVDTRFEWNEFSTNRFYYVFLFFAFILQTVIDIVCYYLMPSVILSNVKDATPTRFGLRYCGNAVEWNFLLFSEVRRKSAVFRWMSKFWNDPKSHQTVNNFSGYRCSQHSCGLLSDRSNVFSWTNRILGFP